MRVRVRVRVRVRCGAVRCGCVAGASLVCHWCVTGASLVRRGYGRVRAAGVAGAVRAARLAKQELRAAPMCSLAPSGVGSDTTQASGTKTPALCLMPY